MAIPPAVLFQDTAKTGYLAESCAGWRAAIGELIEPASIPNIRRIGYRSVPCIVGTDLGTVHAFLRGFDLEGHPIEPHLTEDPEKHPPFTRKDELEGIAPNVGRPFSSIEVGDVISITVPKVVVYRTASPSGLVPQLAVDWEGPARTGLWFPRSTPSGGRGDRCGSGGASPGPPEHTYILGTP